MGECCLCGLGMAIRSVYRTKYNVKGSMCEDFMVTICCLPCATCQLKRQTSTGGSSRGSSEALQNPHTTEDQTQL